MTPSKRIRNCVTVSAFIEGFSYVVISNLMTFLTRSLPVAVEIMQSDHELYCSLFS